jgi:TPR repeat protein
MRRRLSIVRLGAAAALLPPIARARQLAAAAMFPFVVVSPGLAQDQDATTALVFACDRAAAMPSDKNRPFGGPAVFFASIDPKIAIPACEEAAAAEPENPRILFQLGRAYAAAKADESARAYFQKASDLGYPPAQANLGAFYAFGRAGLARNDEEALRLFRLAADQGDGFGYNNIGFFYEVGRGGLPKDENAAARQYKFAAEAGEAWGQYNVARFHEAGRGGLAADEREAARLYRLAADQRHAPAEVSLGFFYQTGRGGLPKDDREALTLYQRAAAQGNAAGQYNLGRFYQQGLGGLPQSDEEAVRLYRLAAEQGHVAGQGNLGFMYETGRGGLPQDDAEAVRLYRLAAEQGGPFAQNKLATFYEEGRNGLPKNIDEAIRLYKLAAEQDRNLERKRQASDALSRLGVPTAAVSPAAPPRSPPVVPVIGFLDTSSPSTNRFGISAFRSALGEVGYVEGKNVAIDFRWANNQREMYELAADMVRRRVDVIVASGGLLAARAAKSATDTVPIVVVGGGDPVAAGLAKSLNRPGGNVTGVTSALNQHASKRLELLLDLVPDATAIGYLVNSSAGPDADPQALLSAARAKGRELIVIEFRTMADVEAAFEQLSQRQAGGVVVSAFPLLTNNSNKVVALAARYKIPAIYAGSSYAYQGGLMSYMGQISMLDVVTQYVARILKGDKPADLPIQTPTKFELILNLRTAKALGLSPPLTTLAIADKVIE